MGQNNTTYYSSPIQIPGTTWSSASTGQSSGNRGYSISTKTDGTLWSWGRNQHGQLGQNNTTYYSSPVQIPGNQWKNFTASGTYYTLATKIDNTLWTWGFNYSGQLGQNNQIYEILIYHLFHLNY